MLEGTEIKRENLNNVLPVREFTNFLIYEDLPDWGLNKGNESRCYSREVCGQIEMINQIVLMLGY